MRRRGLKILEDMTEAEANRFINNWTVPNCENYCSYNLLSWESNKIFDIRGKLW